MSEVAATRAAGQRALPSSPYKGLVPYTEEDAPFFFGREAEREIIISNLMSWRLTLLYGASGVGKSSVLRAEAVNELRRMSREHFEWRGKPKHAVVVFSSWRDDPIAGLLKQVEEAVTEAWLGHNPGSVPPSRMLGPVLQAWTERLDGELYIILDQFEEYFLYHPHEDGEGTFAYEFPRAVNRPDLRVNFLISIREDALAKLDRFKGRIPELFDNYLRIEHLSVDAARAAIIKPLEVYNRKVQEASPAPNGSNAPHPSSIEPGLVEAVLAQVKTGQVVLGEAGRGGLDNTASSGAGQIETPYLQLVMTRLWNTEAQIKSPLLRLETLNRLGGAGQIVRTHLDAVMSSLPPEEQEIAAQVFHYLVTPSGTKIAYTIPDLSAYAKLPESRLAPVLEKLSGSGIRILRPVAPPLNQSGGVRYEIFHDVLAPAILDWRRRYVQAQERAVAERQLAQERAAASARLEQERATAAEKLAKARRRNKWLRISLIPVGLAALIFAIILGINYYNTQQKDEAWAEVLKRALEVEVRGNNNAVIMMNDLGVPSEVFDKLKQKFPNRVVVVSDDDFTIARRDTLSRQLGRPVLAIRCEVSLESTSTYAKVTVLPLGSKNIREYRVDYNKQTNDWQEAKPT